MRHTLWIVMVGVFAVVAYAGWQIHTDLGQFRDLNNGLRQFVSDTTAEIRELRKRMSSVTTTYDSSSGTITVQTTMKDNETEAEWATRHQDNVSAMQAVFPPV